MRSVRLPEVNTKNMPWRLETSRSSSSEEVDSCGVPNHLIGECPKPLKDKNQRVEGSWSDSGEEDDEKTKKPERPKNANEALIDESWIIATQEELNQFIANDVWELVPQPRNMTIIETKWVFRNKLDENGIVSRNKVRILLAYACALDFKLFQIDVKSAFLNGFINEEVYVAQPPGFIDFEIPDHVYKLKKALYGLKQAPKAWPDIMFSVCLCAYFQEAPKTSHLEAVKRIFRYIKGTTHLGDYGILRGLVYADSDHAGFMWNEKVLAVFVRLWDVV
ncbi:retrovirus-related pol polyprotein from transposon TNT 1-94 [Tanacetum coccineum]